MSSLKRVFAALVLCDLLIVAAVAQQSSQKTTAPPKRPATKQPSAEPPQKRVAPLSADEQARKQAVLNSAAWRRAVFEMTEWLSAQKVYNSQQVARMKAEFNERVARASAEELQFMLDDMSAKFQILDTPQAQEARAWMAQYLSVLSTKKRDEVLKGAPDFVNMTAGQLTQELAKIQRERAAISRDYRPTPMPTNPWAQSNALAQQAYLADQSAAGSAAYSSPYRPPSTQKPFDDVQVGGGMQYYIGPYGGIGMVYSPNSW